MLELDQTVAGRFVVEAELGEGGCARVWRIRHAELGSVYALKMLTVLRSDIAERFLTEGRIQSQLRHPHIVPVHDVVRHMGFVGLVMDYIPGPTLADWLADRGPVPIMEAMQLFDPVCDAVAAAHRHGVLHRDLKPSNVLLDIRTGHPVPKVGDFGIAKVVEDSLGSSSTRLGLGMGTPGYLAPEQAYDAASVDERTDVFALGAILYEILAGRPAWNPGVPDVRKVPPPAHLDTLDLDVPSELADCVASCLAADRTLRPPDVATLRSAIAPWCSGQSKAEWRSSDSELRLGKALRSAQEATPTTMLPLSEVDLDLGAAPGVPITLLPGDSPDGSRWLTLALALGTTLGLLALVAGGLALSSVVYPPTPAPSQTSPTPEVREPEAAARAAQDAAPRPPSPEGVDQASAGPDDRSSPQAPPADDPSLRAPESVSRPATSTAPGKGLPRGGAPQDRAPEDRVRSSPTPSPEAPSLAAPPAPAPTPVSGAAVSGTVTVQGLPGERVRLRQVGGGPLLAPGSIAPGRYDVLADFGDGLEPAGGPLVISAGQQLSIYCSVPRAACQ